MSIRYYVAPVGSDIFCNADIVIKVRRGSFDSSGWSRWNMWNIRNWRRRIDWRRRRINIEWRRSRNRGRCDRS